MRREYSDGAGDASGASNNLAFRFTREIFSQCVAAVDTTHPVIDPDVMTGVFTALTLRAGQVLLLCGTVRSKNAAAVALRGLLDLAVVTLTLWAVGGVFFARLGDPHPYLPTLSHLLGNDGLRAMSLLPAAMILTAAVLGSTAERTRLMPTLLFAALVGGVLLPLLLRLMTELPLGYHSANSLGLIAFVGGGMAAVVLAKLVGPRKGKFNRDLSANFVPGHAVVFQFVGLLFLAGWFVAVSPNSLHTILGGCVGTLAGATYGRVRFEKIDVGLVVSAMIGGLCAGSVASITPGRGELVIDFLAHGATAVVAGAVAGVAVPWTLLRLETVHRVDDPAGFSAAYVIGGTVGVLAHALTYVPTGDGYLTRFAVDAGVWLAAAAAFGGVAWGVGKIFQARGTLRVSETSEFDGLDLADLDVNAYPDFQQTMIKSHHLRQL